MDPLSITASTIAILELTTACARVTKDYLAGVQNHPKEIATFFEELDNFERVLKQIETLSRRAGDDGKGKNQTNTGSNTPEAGTSQGWSNVGSLPAVRKMIAEGGPLQLCHKKLLAFKTKIDQNSRSRIRRALKWPFDKAEIQAINERLNGLKVDLLTAIGTDSIELLLLQNESRNPKELAGTQEFISKISGWLSPPDPSWNLTSASNQHQIDTGNWLLRSPDFLDWMNTGGSFFWLHGKTGSGKTILTSTVIHSLSDPSLQHTSVIYYYFDFQVREKQLVHPFLKYLIFQLLNHFKLNAKSVLQGLYDSSLSGSRNPTERELIEAIRRVIGLSPAFFLILDALDECLERDKLLDFLGELQSWEQAKISVFATSRREPDIEDSLSTTATHIISLEDNVIDNDILLYINNQLQSKKGLSKWPEDIKAEIRSTLLNGANGMFRWVACQLEAIGRCLNALQLEKTLHSLPKTLDDTYARILDELDEDLVEYVDRILAYLICSFHPIAVQELAEIVPIVAEGDVYYDPRRKFRESRAILHMCKGLVTTSKSSRSIAQPDSGVSLEEIRFAHFSVKEYLVSGRVAPSKTAKFHLEERLAHQVLASLCIRYLHYCHQENYCEKPGFLEIGDNYLDVAAFAPYAASFWSCHLREARLESSSAIYKECLKIFIEPALLQDSIRLRDLGYKQHDVLAPIFGNESPAYPSFEYTIDLKLLPPIYYASILGLDHIVSLLLSEGADPNCGTREGTCLAAAVAGNNYSTVKLLLARGADVDLPVLQAVMDGESCYSKTPLHEAVHRRNKSMVVLLLANKADPNLARWQLDHFNTHDYPKTNTALEEAVNRGERDLVSLLLDAGADPNAIGGDNGRALEFIATCTTDNGIMELLLMAGADPNLTSNASGIQSPLFRSALFGNRKHVDLLVKWGVDLETLDPCIVQNVLLNWITEEKALRFNLQTVIQIRPDMNMDMAIMTAAKFGLIDILKLLLEHGISPDTQEDSGLAVLHAAAITPLCEAEAVQALLEAGANADMEGGYLGSALQAAALSGKSNVVRTLLQKGAPVSQTSGLYGSALMIARTRLSDQQMECPETWQPPRDYPDLIHYGGLSGFFPEDDWGFSRGTRDPALAKSPNDAKYEAEINIAHLPYADYQAIIDLLLSYGATDI
ncbi:hypothetical protein ACLMJK_008001 [Lecanora helva]